MKGRRQIFLPAVFGILIAAVVFALLRQPPEPSFQGRTLSEWVDDISPTPLGRSARLGTVTFMPVRVVNTRTGAFVVRPPGVFGQQTPQHTAATQAIREIGTNALPYLLRTIYSQDPPWKTKFVDVWRKQKWVKPPFKTATEKQAHALPALRELGPAATVWTWVEILTNRLASAEMQYYAASTLSTFGKEATAALTTLLQMQDHPHPNARYAIRDTIHYCDREGFLTALYNVRYETNANVRASGAWSLGHLGKNPDMSLPALARAANDPSGHVRESAIGALAKFNSVANETTNLIIRALNDPERRVRRAATNALERIRTTRYNGNTADLLLETRYPVCYTGH